MMRAVAVVVALVCLPWCVVFGLVAPPSTRLVRSRLDAKGFGGSATKKGAKSGATTKKRKATGSAPEPVAAAAPPALDKWGLPSEPVDENVCVALGARKVSLEGGVDGVSVAEAGERLAHDTCHPIDLSDERLEVLHLDPPVYRVRGLLSAEECGALIALTGTGRCREMPKEAGTFRPGEALRRTSTTWYARFREPPVVPLLERAAALFRGVPTSRFEELQIARYLPGEIFKWHEDAVPPSLLRASDGGQRVATLLVYLTGDGGDAQGGHTCFRDLGASPPLKVAPRAGDALLFFPALHPSAKHDDRTLHQADQAVAEKWVSQLWLHQYDYPTVILDDNPRP